MLTELNNTIRESGIQKGYIASKLGITPATLSNKLHGRAPIFIDEAFKILEIIGVKCTAKNLERLFFANKVERKCRE